MKVKIILVLCVVIITLTGCSLFAKKNKNEDIESNNSIGLYELLSKKDNNDKKPDGEIVSEYYGSGFGSWQNAYVSYIENNFGDRENYHYSLIYLDDDTQPELWVNSYVEAGGEKAASYDVKNDRISIVQLRRIGSTYIPYSGLIYNNCGHMDHYPVFVYKLYDGEFYKIGEGKWGGFDWKSNRPELNENGEIIYQYEWKGIRYSEEEFYKKINELYIIDNGIRDNNAYQKDDIIRIIKNSK